LTYTLIRHIISIYIGTVIQYRNISLIVRSKDHNPAHVHAISPDGEAKIVIESLECFYLRGFTERDLKRILKVVKERQEILMEVWNEYHS